ncbi:MAG: S-methyl-5'-thioadenosine phosphorylase [Sandaracinaceae bacterium]
MSARVLGVIGGSGLYRMEGLTDLDEHAVDTTFGAPSDVVISGRIGDTRLLFLPRHGQGHRFAPHEINYRANILALKQLGAEQIVSVSAVGSMKESIHPGDIVLVDQFVDRTRHRVNTFFEGLGVVAHVGFSDPIDHALSSALYRAALERGARAHRGGTYVCIDGPQFSTRAESNLFRSWGVDVIGMTNLPEARLAREAELPYATIALATDYDCWHQGEAAVSVEAVVAVLQQNVAVAQSILRTVAASLPDPKESPASRALENAVMTSSDRISAEARRKLAPLAPRLFDRSNSES